MVFRKDNKVDAFQRQISALRQQLGAEEEHEDSAAPNAYNDALQGEGASAGGQVEARSYGAREDDGYSRAGSEYGAPARDPFAPEQEAPAVPVLPRAGGDADTSVIAHDATWSGEFRTEGTVHVHGRFEGSIVAKQDVYVAEEADVDATVSAQNVIIAGLVKGSIRCDARFEVLPQGRIFGDIQAPTLVVHEGARITGQFRTGVPEAATPEPASPAVVQRRAARGG